MSEAGQFREQLEKRLQFLRDQNEGIRLKQASIALYSPDVADMANNEAETELDLKLYARNDVAITELCRTLDSLDSLSYGICELCGEDIDPRRLKIVPDTKFCVSCQRVMESSVMSA
ncbi:MAG: TraR/DksA family transcriptional regulator [Desulfovibrionales bacterium]